MRSQAQAGILFTHFLPSPKNNADLMHQEQRTFLWKDSNTDSVTKSTTTSWRGSQLKNMLINPLRKRKSTTSLALCRYHLRKETPFRMLRGK
ncbi:hypothetical protein NPIL_453631 [Nephila pilipes]|uniref:Uncharacterized protein n=1 Tax=Nephila pilipes TaxID=299642 RepID=A0A8X6I804_NEPPI|nr:hypothetical protein NPIL_453631 [Nephila pilipes]